MGWLLKKAASSKLAVAAVAMIHPITIPSSSSSSPTTTTNLFKINLIFNTNKTPPHSYYSTRSFNLILRPPPSLTYAPPLCSAVSKTMTTQPTNNTSGDTLVLDHDALLKHKRTLRTKVRMDLKSMDPAQRSQEGTCFT